MPTKSIAVRLPDELYDYLVARAEKEHRTLSNMIISLLMDAKEHRCNDCKHLANMYKCPCFYSKEKQPDDWFCADWERKDT